MDVAVESIDAQVTYLTTRVQSLDVMVQQFMFGDEKELDEVNEHEDRSDEFSVSDEHEVPGVAQGRASVQRKLVFASQGRLIASDTALDMREPLIVARSAAVRREAGDANAPVPTPGSSPVKKKERFA